MPKTCFVIGPIGEAGSPIRADADDFMKYVVSDCPALQEFGYSEPVRADKLGEPGRITSQIIKLLNEADLVIADLTGNNPNVYYELSFRHAIGKPVIHMAVVGTPLSFDVRDNRTIFYTMHSRAAENARDELANQIRRVHQAGYKAMNPILETVSIINLERDADPVQQTIGTLMEMVESLAGDVKSIASAQDINNRLIANNSSIFPGVLGAGVPGLLGAAALPPRNYLAGAGGSGSNAGGGILGNIGALDHALSSHTPPEPKPQGKPKK